MATTYGDWGTGTVPFDDAKDIDSIEDMLYVCEHGCDHCMWKHPHDTVDHPAVCYDPVPLDGIVGEWCESERKSTAYLAEVLSKQLADQTSHTREVQGYWAIMKYGTNVHYTNQK